jgi:hypothetical protein
VRIFRGEKQYVAECLDLPVVTEAPTLDQLAVNIREATTLRLEGERLGGVGFRSGCHHRRPGLAIFPYARAFVMPELDLFKSWSHNVLVKPDSIRTSIDLPRELHRRLHEAAARKGCSARQLILASIERAVEQAEPMRPRHRLSLDPPLIPPAGRCINLTDADIYDLIELP